MDAEPLRPAEFCALERQLVAGMAMRKKRNVQMGPVQQLKFQLLEQVEAADPEIAQFTAAGRIERSCRLVHQENSRINCEGSRDGDSLCLATR